MRIGVLSDTHIPSRARAIPRAVLDAFQGVDLILHAGDLTVLAVLDQLREIAPVIAVHGNVDSPEVMAALPTRQIVPAGGFQIGLVHGNDGRGPTPMVALHSFAPNEVDCVVFGHSHQPLCRREVSVLLLNPGSPTDPRSAGRPSYAILTADEELSAEIVRF